MNRNNYFDRLPHELKIHMYSFDPTYKRLIYDEVVREFHMIGGIMSDLYYAMEGPDTKIDRSMRRISRKHRKNELKQLAYFLRVRLPRKITKYRITSVLAFKMACDMCGFP